MVKPGISSGLSAQTRAGFPPEINRMSVSNRTGEGNREFFSRLDRF
jgi:hypothetical protein